MDSLKKIRNTCLRTWNAEQNVCTLHMRDHMSHHDDGVMLVKGRGTQAHLEVNLIMLVCVWMSMFPD